MSRNPAPEDLLVHARRDQLDDRDERRLALTLDSSRELRLLYEAGVGFDAEASLRPGDEARAARLVERAMNELEPAPPKRLRLGRQPSARYFALSVGCGVLLSVAVASAWQYAQARWLAPQSLHRPSRSLPVRAAPVVADAPPSRAPLAASPEPALQDEAKVAPKPAAPVRTVPGARELFTRASEARRRGDDEAAITLYEQLVAAHPRSIEAGDARLMLGNLRLEQRAPRAALSHFENYGDGALSLEALWGKARALRELESPEERAVLEQLLRDYPSSPYAATAKKRLQQLPR